MLICHQPPVQTPPVPGARFLTEKFEISAWLQPDGVIVYAAETIGQRLVSSDARAFRGFPEFATVQRLARIEAAKETGQEGKAGAFLKRGFMWRWFVREGEGRVYRQGAVPEAVFEPRRDAAHWAEVEAERILADERSRQAV